MEWLIVTLVVVNIPVYLLIGWLVFDDKQNAASSFWETVVLVLKSAFIPPILRYMIWEGQDEHDGGSIVNVVLFFIACIAVTAGEYYALTTWVLVA